MRSTAPQCTALRRLRLENGADGCVEGPDAGESCATWAVDCISRTVVDALGRAGAAADESVAGVVDGLVCARLSADASLPGVLAAIMGVIGAQGPGDEQAVTVD